MGVTPQLLCLHPGGFALGDPTFENDAVAYAQSLGFGAMSGNYPMTSLDRQRKWCINAVAALERSGPVYAYGDSAGGALAGFLASRGRLRAAASYGAVPDLWYFFSQSYGTSYWNALGNPTRADCNATSPGQHLMQCPVHAYRGETDAFTPLSIYQAWDASDPNLRAIPVAGDHLSSGPPNATYELNMKRAIRWLGYKAGLVTL